MSEEFFTKPILNSPYEYPDRHWELDEDGQPTNRILPYRRSARFIAPVPKPRKRKDKKAGGYRQAALAIGAEGLTPAERQSETTSMVNSIRSRVDQWRLIPNPADWRVTPETARLLQHWRGHPFQGIRPFFCQIEAVETAIWLTEVAPASNQGKRFLEWLARANREANRDLPRLALKLATGAGKTTVMAMLIAWQTVNAVRRSRSKQFTRGFLVCAPGLTIKDRLRVLQPNDPDVSTDLGVAYYYTSQHDRALEQFNHSLSVDPTHTKTMLNVGIVKAQGKKDLAGAIEAWEQVVKMAPDSPEGQTARQLIDSLRSAHPDVSERPGG